MIGDLRRIVHSGFTGLLLSVMISTRAIASSSIESRSAQNSRETKETFEQFCQQCTALKADDELEFVKLCREFWTSLRRGVAAGTQNAGDQSALEFFSHVEQFIRRYPRSRFADDAQWILDAADGMDLSAKRLAWIGRYPDAHFEDETFQCFGKIFPEYVNEPSPIFWAKVDVVMDSAVSGDWPTVSRVGKPVIDEYGSFFKPDSRFGLRKVFQYLGAYTITALRHQGRLSELDELQGKVKNYFESGNTFQETLKKVEDQFESKRPTRERANALTLP